MENPPGIHGWIHVKSPLGDSLVVLSQVKYAPAATDPQGDVVILTAAVEAVTCTCLVRQQLLQMLFRQSELKQGSVSKHIKISSLCLELPNDVVGFLDSITNDYY
ncbi:hypothetical protein CDAR_572091 [Caerostris darwini]|uniref:Proteasome assembly chaperone 3 n=1 Tax=Caerostris darwini TaxID=1538125 RepID=A0AAV4RAT8_9ARAC|nr:hypothetical protein CDAR_572091 [Caerostris darwini]